MPLFPVLVPRPHAGAFEAAREAGYSFMRGQIDAESPGEAEACNALLAAYGELAAARRERVRLVQRELERRLTQSLSLARLVTIGGVGIRLLTRNSGTAFGSWPAQDRQRMRALAARFDRAADILAAAETIEAEIAAALTVAAVREIDVRDHPSWPA